MAPATSTLQGGDAAAAVDGVLPGKRFQGVEISVPYARWRGYGTEHGFHKGRITTFSVDEDDCPEGSFTVVFPAAEKTDPINISWEQLLGIKKHGSVKKACVLDKLPDGVTVATAKEQLAAWHRRVGGGEDDEEGEEGEVGQGEEEDDEGEEKGDEGADNEPTGGAGSVEQLDAEGDDEGNGGVGSSVRSSKKRVKKQKQQREAKELDPIWQEVNRSDPPARPVTTPAFSWGGLKHQTTRSTCDDAISSFDRCWPEAVKALQYEETMRYADEQDFDWDATRGPPTRPEVRLT